MFAACLAVAQREYPEVNRVYEGASMTSAALQQMLWPLFKSPQQFAKRDTEVRHYSADKHAQVDVNGNEFHRYGR